MAFSLNNPLFIIPLYVISQASGHRRAPSLILRKPALSELSHVTVGGDSAYGAMVL